MSKKHVNFSTIVMKRITSEHVRMKPAWYFVLGSIAVIVALVGLTILSVFLVSLISFSLRTHGPMGELRFQQMLTSFPWWALILGIVGLVTAVLFLRKYDFSYRKNFFAIIFVFILSILLSGWLIDYLGVDSMWAQRGMMRKLYQQSENQNTIIPKGQFRGRFMSE